MTSIHNTAGVFPNTVNRDSRAQVANENKRYDNRGNNPSSPSFESLLEKSDKPVNQQGERAASSPENNSTMSRLTDLLQQLFQLLQKLQEGHSSPENKPPVETKPPEMETKPPVETKPPEMEAKPPVESELPTVQIERETYADELQLTRSQHSFLERRFGGGTDNSSSTFAGALIDKNGDGKISAGDVAKIQVSSGFFSENPTNKIHDIAIDQELAATLNKLDAGPKPSVTKSQSLDFEQNNNALALFGTASRAGLEINHVEFVDKNADGKVSEGDDILLFQDIDEQIGIDDSIQERPEVKPTRTLTLTAAQADQINQSVKPALQLNSDQQRAALEILPDYKGKGSVIDIRDNDGDGKVSEGDTAIHRVRHDNGSSEVRRSFLDAEMVDQFEQSSKPEIPLKINDNTLDALKERYSFNGPDATVIDKDNSGKISAGDLLRLTVPGTERQVGEFKISQEDADVINGQVNTLRLTPEQNTALGDLLNSSEDHSSNNELRTTFTGKVLDRDGDGRVSVGDDAIISKQNFTHGKPFSTPARSEHRLTVEDLAKIDPGPVNTSIVSGGGVSVGENLTAEGIRDSRIVEIEGKQYSVGFLKEQVEDFAQSSYANNSSNNPDGGLVAQVAGTFDWGYSSLSSAGHAFESYIADTFPRGEGHDAPTGNIDYSRPDVSEFPKALSLTDQQNEILENKFIPQNENVSGGAGIWDTDGDNRISIGDEIQFGFSTTTIMDDGSESIGDVSGKNVVDASLLKELGISEPIDNSSPPVNASEPKGVVDHEVGQKPDSNFSDWAKKNIGDINKDGKFDDTDIKDWLKGVNPSKNNPVSKPPVEPPTNKPTELKPMTPLVPLAVDNRFSLNVPGGSTHQALQGADSIVGKIESPDYKISYDLGLYGGITHPATTGVENFQSKELTVDGKPATIATFFNANEGVEHPYTAEINIKLSEGGLSKSLKLNAQLDSAEQFSEIEQVFKSVELSNI